MRWKGRNSLHHSLFLSSARTWPKINGKKWSFASNNSNLISRKSLCSTYSVTGLAIVRDASSSRNRIRSSRGLICWWIKVIIS